MTESLSERLRKASDDLIGFEVGTQHLLDCPYANKDGVCKPWREIEVQEEEARGHG